MKKLMAIVATALLAMGLAVLAVAAPASAHTHQVTPACGSLSIKLQSYDGSGKNTVTATIAANGTTTTLVPAGTTFSGDFVNTYTFDKTVNYTWHVVVHANDDQQYSFDQSGTTGNCLTGAEPLWTEPTCGDSSGHYTIPTTPGVEYLVGGVVKSAGIYDVAALGSVTVTAQVVDTTNSTYTGVASWSHTFKDVPAAASCTTLVVPVAPGVVKITTCGTLGSITVDKTVGVVYTFVVGNANQTSGPYEIHATPAAGYAFGPGTVQPAALGAAAAVIPQLIIYKGTLGDPVTCTTLPHDPKAVPITCVLDNVNHTATKVGGYIEVSPVDGVTYTITGGPVGGPAITPIVIPYNGNSTPVDTTLPAGNYVVTASGVNLAPGINPFPLSIVDNAGLCVPTLAFTDGSVTPTDQVCSSGKLQSGFITVALDPATLHYELNGQTLAAKTNVAPGTYTVNIIPNKGFAIGTPTATVTVHASTAVCGQLTTLAFTGGSLVGYAYLAAASMFLMAGGVFFMHSRRQKNAI